MTQEELYVVKLLQLKWTVSQVALKMGWSESRVKEVVKGLARKLEVDQKNGYADLVSRFSCLCESYRMVGELLKEVGGALSVRMSEEQIRELIVEDRETTLNNLMERAIVLLPYVPPPAAPKEKQTPPSENN